ncbi:methyl-accepting chemotaxis protein [Stutzerimonas nitrititolerans]|uniref:methyl-accepting chemotaxis protein n=1 Tax=Stutzerimonas nitrititolerans TaxID=2482751 RepID=UPI0028A05485|nr:methyl-accepting chemotaxis protein [Stutzerimonas nitrititolerans]
MFASRSGIAGQLGVALCTVLIIVIGSSSLFALRSLGQSTEQAHRQHLQSEAQLLAEQLSSFQQSLRINTERLAMLFERRFASGLERDGNGAEPTLRLDGQVLNGDFTLVDEFRDLTAGTATIFVRTGDDFLRVTTSVTKEDGSRAIGTRLDRTHPAYALLMKGQRYVGRAFLFGRHYMTQYTPVRDSAGAIIAVLYVGFDYTDARQQQFDSLSAFRIGQSGSLAIRDEQGVWLVRPDGAQELAALDQALNARETDVRWQDGASEFLSVAAPVEGEDWQVVATLPEAEVKALTWQVGTRLAIGSGIALLLAVAACILLLRQRLRPLGRVVNQARALGEGDLGARLQIERQDEIGTLSSSFNQMADSLAGTVAEVRNASGDVIQRADHLDALARETRQRSAEQAAQLDSMASAVEQFSATASGIAAGMQRTEHLTVENEARTRQGAELMQSSSEALQQIARSLEATAGIMNELGERSQKIGGIVGVISGIAEQTNLLALNAAIEAARAGEQGRGFAVVADEVRNLAARTSQATGEIAEVIVSVQDETTRAVASIDDGNRLMQQGLALNQTVASTFQEIHAHTTQTLEQVAEIARASSEQSDTATLLSRNLHAVAEDNQSTRQAGNRLAETAGELKALADTLQREVNRFR